MKKLMMAACAIAFAAVAQAATVTWHTGTLYAPGADGNGWAAEWADFVPAGSSVGIQLLISASADMSDPLTITGMESSYKVSEYYTADGTATATLSASAEGVTYYTQMIVTYGNSTLTSDVVSFDSVTTADPDLQFSDGGAGIVALPGHELSVITGAFPEATGWVAAPEPTSGLLLLIGMGALALRRRRA